MAEPVDFVITSSIANLHVAPGGAFRKLSPEQQEKARKNLIKSLEKVLEKQTKIHLPELSKKKRKAKAQKNTTA